MYNRERPLWPQQARPGGQGPHHSAPVLRGTPAPRGRAADSAQHRLPLRATLSLSAQSWARQLLIQQHLAPSAPTGRQLKDAQQGWPGIQLPPHAILGPLSHAPLLTQGHPAGSGAPATAGWGTGHSGWHGREAVLPQTSRPWFQRNGAGLFHGAACTFWELFLPPRGTPFHFQLPGKLQSPASPEEGRGQRKERRRPLRDPLGMRLSFKSPG